VDSDNGESNNPITQNGYTYGNNNPVMNIDPDGNTTYPRYGKFYIPVLGASIIITAGIIKISGMTVSAGSWIYNKIRA
jgi:hypothetical protein